MHADADRSRYGDPAFQIHETSRSGWARLVVTGELDVSTALTFRRRLRALKATNTAVYLDLSQVEFMDSVGARAVLDAVEATHEGTWGVEIGPGLSRQAKRCFDLIRAAGWYEDS